MNEALHMLLNSPVLRQAARAAQTVWVNPAYAPAAQALASVPFTRADVEDAAARLDRFAPLIKARFPETAAQNGRIESPLTPIPQMQRVLAGDAAEFSGSLYLKRDSDLPVAGSVKARGGIYEVLKHTEELALKHGLLGVGDSYEKLLCDDCRAFFSKYTIQVGSTGNLGLSIGIMSAALGYRAIVHMSADAREWKKALLRRHGVTVVEYPSDYSAAVSSGRKLSEQDPMSYFVDDENSESLFLGYAVAAGRLRMQLLEQGVLVDAAHPLFVYIPCGVGGAAGGITFGLKLLFGDAVHTFFVEPTQAPCMLLGMATGLLSGICVQDAGLSGQTHADGLAVGRPSGLVGGVMRELLSGIFTVQDAQLFDFLRDCMRTEGLFLEPSACAAFAGPARLWTYADTRAYIERRNLSEHMQNSTHIVWATGGGLVPQSVREEYLQTYL